MAFNEDWYSKSQVARLIKLYKRVRPLEGLIIEIGCWEGKSTCALANAIHPEVLHAVDTWQGNITEGADHPTVKILKERDVYQTFLDNVARLTKGNVVVHRQDCFEYLTTVHEPIKFCHIDAAHDYESVKRTIDLLLPRLVPGAILCGDDYLNAHAGRADLQGGVERACRETLKGHYNRGNLWVWSNGPTLAAPFWQRTRDRLLNFGRSR